MQKPKLPWVKMIVFLPFSLVLCGIALLGLVYAPELWLVSSLLLWFSAQPYVWWLSKKIHADIAYAERDHSANEGEALEWDEEDPIDMELLDIVINGTGRNND